MKRFSHHSMLEILNFLENELQKNENKIIEFEVLNPDIKESIYAGTIIELNSENYIYRGYKTWIDLAQKLKCKMLTPLLTDENIVKIRFQKLQENKNFHKDSEDDEKYGSDSTFSLINKLEESEFLITYLDALKNVKINEKKRVLNLGINRADEFEIIKQISQNFQNIEFVGIDFCSSAIKEANEKFKNDDNVKFYQYDITKLDELDLGEFDLIISIGTLQSSNLEFNKTFMHIVQNYLKKDGSMILGFPNCRWLDGEIIYGAKIKNYSYSEMSNLFKDAVFCKKYLQQKKFRVTLTGKYYIFLTATSIRKN